MARLDRLAPVKEVAQIGAVIGREFSHELLAAVSPLPEDQLNAALDQLVASELVFRRGTPPEATYTFKHALVQDAAYQSLLKPGASSCTRASRRAGGAFPGHARPSPNCSRITAPKRGLADKAIPYWRSAGEQSRRRSANLEAIANLRKALELLEALPESLERTARS